jgi:hypothetical protein
MLVRQTKKFCHAWSSVQEEVSPLACMASPSTNHAPADRPLALYKWQRLSPTDIKHSPIPLFCKSISKLDLELSFFQLQDQSIQ